MKRRDLFKTLATVAAVPFLPKIAGAATSPTPRNIEEARILASQDPKAFRDWAVRAVGGYPRPSGYEGCDGELVTNLSMTLIKVYPGALTKEQLKKASPFWGRNWVLIAWSDQITREIRLASRDAGAYHLFVQSIAEIRASGFENPDIAFPHLQFVTIEDLLNPSLHFGGVLVPGEIKRPA
jgi:hypothetical protein